MSEALPYGLQLMADGSAVLFSRGYRVLWRRDAEGNVTKGDSVKVAIPADHHGVEWFYDDHTPRAQREEAAECALAEWGLL